MRCEYNEEKVISSPQATHNGCWLADQPYQWNYLHTLQGRGPFLQRRPGDLLQTSDQRALRLLQPQPPAGAEPRPARLRQPGDEADEAEESEARAGRDGRLGLQRSVVLTCCPLYCVQLSIDNYIWCERQYNVINLFIFHFLHDSWQLIVFFPQHLPGKKFHEL